MPQPKILNPAKDILLPQHEQLEKIGLSLLEKHNLIEKGWGWGWTKEKNALGRCYFNSKTITLSKYWCLFLPEKENTDTILHEIAHALTLEQYFIDRREVDVREWNLMVKAYLSHELVWQLICEKIGAKPQKCYDGMVKLPNIKGFKRA